MAKPQYWDSSQVAEFLGIKPNNLRQITYRMTRDHQVMGHRNDKCSHLTVDHVGMGKAWFKVEKVKDYSLYRKGEISLINTVVRQTRDQRRKTTVKAGLTKGRPSNK